LFKTTRSNVKYFDFLVLYNNSSCVDGIELFLYPEVTSSVGVLLNLLQRVGAIDKILLRIQKCHAAPMDFLTLSSTLKAAVAICNTLAHDFKEHISRALHQGSDEQMAGVASGLPSPEFAHRSLVFLDSILERCYVPALQDLYERITSIVDEEITAQVKDSVVIQFGFNEELDNAKEAFDCLSGKLKSIVAEFANPAEVQWYYR